MGNNTPPIRLEYRAALAYGRRAAKPETHLAETVEHLLAGTERPQRWCARFIALLDAALRAKAIPPVDTASLYRLTDWIISASAADRIHWIGQWCLDADPANTAVYICAARARGLPAAEIADRLTVSRSHLYAVIEGYRPPPVRASSRIVANIHRLADDTPAAPPLFSG